MVPPPTRPHTAATAATSAVTNALSMDSLSEIRAKFEVAVNKIDKKLSSYPFVAQAAQAVGLRPYWIPIAILCVVSILFGVFDSFITSAVGFFYPAFQSFKAVESPDLSDDRQWLTYWVVYGFFSLIETFADILLFWVPLYYLLKILFLLWLFLPQFKGATIVYGSVVRPVLLRFQKDIDSAINKVTAQGQKLISEGEDLLHQKNK